jgi:DtxR family Mn-dependent transcriptional regulator
MSSTRRSNSSPPGTPSARSPRIAEQPVTSPASAPASATLSTVAENYLKVIYSHTEWQPDPISSSQLAARLGLAPSSVTEMVKKLTLQGLVEHALYGSIVLTARGRTEALRMVRRHRLIETWLVGEFGYGWDEVHDEAEVLEHVLSDRMLAAIDARLGYPTADPHGDPIPSADLTVPPVSGVLASTLAAGQRGRVVRISDRDAGVLRELTAAGIGIGSAIAVDEVTVAMAAAIWVQPSS